MSFTFDLQPSGSMATLLVDDLLWEPMHISQNIVCDNYELKYCALYKTYMLAKYDICSENIQYVKLSM